MVPRLQSRVGFPSGDCVRASYASLLELPLEKVPNFDPMSIQYQDQWSAEQKWLDTRGLDLIVVPYLEGHKIRVPREMYHLIAGRSPRDPKWGHRVVGRGGVVVWDPHPSHAGIEDIHQFLFVVPKQKR